MPITPVNFNINKMNEHQKECSFGHGHHQKANNYTTKQKAIVATGATLGVLGSLALLAHHAGYSIKPSKILKDFKNSYIAKADFEAKEVITLGAGSCLGGLAAGYIADKNPHNRRAKRREAIMQIGNVSIPILFVHVINKYICKNASKMTKSLASLGGVALGVMSSNIIMNRLNNAIFKEKTGEGRKMKITDFSAHLDDVVVAASYISKADWVHAIGRLVPAALIIPGLEVGNKTAD